MIKVIVAQPGRQHTHFLLQALFSKKMLLKFYTVFAANKLDLLSHLFPDKVKSQLKKRSFPNIPAKKINHRPFLFLQEQLGKIDSEIEMIKKVYQPFDHYVTKDLHRLKVDVIIGYENANLEAFKTARQLGITTVLDLAQIHHEGILEIQRQFGFLDQRYTPEVLTFINSRKTEALANTDYIFTLSTFSKESLIKNGIPEHKIFTLNLGLQLKNFYPKKSDIEPSKFRFLFVGTITRRKGLELLLEAFKSLEFSNAELVLIGPMADGESLLQQYKGCFTYHPFMHHEKLADAYRAADVFVFPSYLDSWAQTVVEAMACGTPAIVSENTGAKDAVVQGGGFVIPVGNIDALKAKMLYCYQNPIILEELGRKAAKIATQYTLENYHNQVIQALNKIAHAENKS